MAERRKNAKKAMQDIAHTTQDMLVGKVEEVKEFVSEKAGHVAHDVKKYSAEGGKKVADTVKKQPLKAIGIAAAVGAVFGFIFRHKRKK
jgi:ElaB/YqjD/DUF883 family membrane-anchored ribosome-binding protein